MRIGCDTGFLVDPARGNEVVTSLAAETQPDEDVLLVFSVVNIFEFLHYSYRTGQADTGRRVIVELQDNPTSLVLNVDVTIAERAAGYRHGLGLHSSDALIVATFVGANCDTMITTDHFLEIAARQGIIKVVFL